MPEQNVQVTQALNDPLEREMAAALTAAGIAFLTGDGGENPSGLDFLLPNGVEIEVKQFHSPRIADQMARAANVIAVQGRSALAWLCGLLTERGQMIRELRETTDVLARHRTRAEPDLVEAATAALPHVVSEEHWINLANALGFDTRDKCIHGSALEDDCGECATLTRADGGDDARR